MRKAMQMLVHMNQTMTINYLNEESQADVSPEEWDLCHCKQPACYAMLYCV